MTVSTLITQFNNLVRENPRPKGQPPLVVKAEIDGASFAVVLRILPVSSPLTVVFERVGFGQAMSVLSFKAALEGIAEVAGNTIIVVMSGVTRYEIVGLRVENNEAVILCTKKTL